jgi:hypothetical protein
MVNKIINYMKKYFITVPCFIALLIVSFNSYAQGKYQMTQSKVSFYSKTPLEDIQAVNKESKGIIDFDSKTFFIKIFIKSFDFPSDLMEEHFNENYMESGKYPEGTFKGKIEGDYNLKKDGVYLINAEGDLVIHGVLQKRIIPCSIIVKNGGISIESAFNIKLEDHKITIPQIVFNKIAEVIEVKIKSPLEKM